VIEQLAMRGGVFAAVVARTDLADGLSLNKLLELSERSCRELAQRAHRPTQVPCFDVKGDITDAALKQFAQPLIHSVSSNKSWKWLKFDPKKLHCLVVVSEHAQIFKEKSTLSERVRNVIHDGGPDIWETFRACYDGWQLLSGTMRTLVPDFDRKLIVTANIGVASAFESAYRLEETIAAVVEADVVFFDVSRFEPKILFLAGVRAETPRGVTICSHGLGWQEGSPLDIPFNLNDLDHSIDWTPGAPRGGRSSSPI